MDNIKQINLNSFDKVLSAFEKIEYAQVHVAAREEVVGLASSLFPSFSDTGVNDVLLSDYTLEQYGYYRSLGLSPSDTAYSIERSAELVYSLLNGVGLSLEKFVELIKQELFARAKCKSRLLRDIEQATDTKNWRTSLTLLEKLYPEEFGNKGGLEDKLDKLVEKEWKINIVEAKESTLEEE